MQTRKHIYYRWLVNNSTDDDPLYVPRRYVSQEEIEKVKKNIKSQINPSADFTYTGVYVATDYNNMFDSIWEPGFYRVFPTTEHSVGFKTLSNGNYLWFHHCSRHYKNFEHELKEFSHRKFEHEQRLYRQNHRISILKKQSSSKQSKRVAQALLLAGELQREACVS